MLLDNTSNRVYNGSVAIDNGHLYKRYHMKSLDIYVENGITVIVLPTYAPRKGEKTFPATKYSIANMGRKQVIMKSIGLKGNRK